MKNSEDPNRPEILVFSDIDGTLIDHDTYSYSAAEECLELLRRHHIPLILASSKTSAEIIPLRRELGFQGSPAICENGAGLIEGDTEAGTSGDDYHRLRRLLNIVPKALRRHFRGFGDMTTEEVVEATGLPADAAVRARRREFSEPGLWSGSEDEKARFLESLNKKGVSATQGGRFLTLSFGATKANRMGEIMARFEAPVSIALGDAPNDVEMINAADYGVIVANPSHAPLPTLDGEKTGRIIRTKKPGPEGWSGAVLRILSNLGIID